MDHLIHDIKTERQNVSGGLPAGYKVVPILFYLGTVTSILLSLFFFLGKKAYEATAEEMTLRASTAKTQSGQYNTQKTKIIADAKKAEGIAKWLEGSAPLQPVTTVIGRSMGKNSTIAELALNRNPEIPAHTFLELKIDGGGSRQIDETLNAIYALNYQTYSANQVKGRGSTDFQATLILSDKE